MDLQTGWIERILSLLIVGSIVHFGFSESPKITARLFLFLFIPLAFIWFPAWCADSNILISYKPKTVRTIGWILLLIIAIPTWIATYRLA
ncbi:MAG: hypothetical protein ACSHYF_15960 [Verrucomicrobiaceae bacterium]